MVNPECRIITVKQRKVEKMECKNLLVSVYDKKVKSWSDLITVPNKPTAVRMMDQLIKSGTSIQSKYPDDFDAYLVGVMGTDDDGHLEIKQITPAEHICCGSDFVKDPNNG